MQSKVIMSLSLWKRLSTPTDFLDATHAYNQYVFVIKRLKIHRRHVFADARMQMDKLWQRTDRRLKLSLLIIRDITARETSSPQ
ncbi:hypothetical protein RRG08_029003 [Elysia crispata]|uniref:Uncharacterized protein n=1 Tax=Elysia crispata TaxID=231223 RepID=A0AAE1EDT7_9GAST|nr:hypothetical protein RRG08_029003 [Elysia crispata]